MRPSDHTSPTLLRSLDLKALSAGLFNTVVGAGIFVLPATVAGLVGTGAAFAYLFCAVAILFVMLAYASAGSRVTDAGGSIAYIHAAFGPLAAHRWNRLRRMPQHRACQPSFPVTQHRMASCAVSSSPGGARLIVAPISPRAARIANTAA